MWVVHDVQAKPWLCEVLITALTKEIHAKYKIDFSPYYMYDWWILNNRPTINGSPVIGVVEEEDRDNEVQKDQKQSTGCED